MSRRRDSKREVVFAVLRGEICRTGICPTVRQIAEKVGIGATSTYRHLVSLEADGRIVAIEQAGFRAWWVKGEPTYGELRSRWEQR